MSTESGASKRQLSRSNRDTETVESFAEGSKGISKQTEDPGPTKHVYVEQAQEGADVDALEKNREGGDDTVITTPSTSNTASNVVPGDGSRQVIAVSANKNPTAFFQLARKFLMTNEMCDLSALEGAIVSAVDAAHLLERSKLATIVGIQTSYVNVAPKPRKHQKGEAATSRSLPSEGLPSTHASEDILSPSQLRLSSPASTSTARGGSVKVEEVTSSSNASDSAADHGISTDVKGGSTHDQKGPERSSSTKANTSTTRNNPSSSSGNSARELRRARILVTVKRTESYKRWLEENPIQRQAIIAGTATVTADDIERSDALSPSPPDGALGTA